ncbi:MAG: ferritin family protein [Desulfuromonadales bacterium]|nr:ferritin family protein [Desulfuromonadales bacterium]
MNVFDFAMKMEMDGKAYYEKLARQTSLAGLRTIFTRLAEDEQKHYEIFQALRTGGKVQTMQESRAIADAQNIFAELVSGAIAAGGSKDDLAAYRHAMKLEADSFRLYEDTAAKESMAEVKGLLLKIAGEEHKHFNILENIYHFVNAPNQYLAWGEFSNLEEFRQFGRDVDG